MKIGIIGVGFVGGATARVLHPHHELYLYDKYQTADWCNEPGNEWSNPPIHTEQGLETLARESEAVFISVPTPAQLNGSVGYINIHNSIKSLQRKVEAAQRNPQELLVIVRSTAVSGTTDGLAKQYPFRVAFNPEFLREAHALEDMKNTGRIVIGANTSEDQKQIALIYRQVFPNAEYIFTDRKTSEMIKYMANGMLTGQIALANEFYQICQAVGINYDTVRETVLFDPRIGRNLDVPGPDGDLGFGGKCFPKDLRALIHLAREFNCEPHLLTELWRLNERVRTKRDWLEIPGATSQNNFGEQE
jgi:UDPglucose 6-dehydrogenase